MAPTASTEPDTDRHRAFGTFRATREAVDNASRHSAAPRRLLAAGLVAALALAGIVGKIAAVSTEAPATDGHVQLAGFLRAHGLTRITPPSADAIPAWITGSNAICRMRIADVAPEGWTATLVAEQAAGDRLSFAYEGRFYPSQPVFKTRLEVYRRAFMRHFGGTPEEPVVRAVALSVGCPHSILGPADAVALSR